MTEYRTFDRHLVTPSTYHLAIFFDAVGTLIYPNPPVGDIYNEIGRRFGANVDAREIERRFRIAFQRQEALDRELVFRTDEERERRRWRTIVAEVFYEFVRSASKGVFEELWTHFARSSAWACYDDVGGCIEWLNAHKIVWGIASNYDSRLRSVVAGLPIFHACRHLAISSEIGWRKPAPQFFAALVGLVSKLPGVEVVFVGDDEENDWRGGRAAGLKTILVQRCAIAGGPGTSEMCPTLDDLPIRLRGLGLLA